MRNGATSAFVDIIAVPACHTPRGAPAWRRSPQRVSACCVGFYSAIFLIPRKGLSPADCIWSNDIECGSIPEYYGMLIKIVLWKYVSLMRVKWLIEYIKTCLGCVDSHWWYFPEKTWNTNILQQMTGPLELQHRYECIAWVELGNYTHLTPRYKAKEWLKQRLYQNQN